MAAPIAGGVNQAAQVAQQTQQIQKPETGPKTGASKFDQMMANKAESAQAVNQANSVQATQQAQSVQKTNHVNAVEKSGKIDELKQTHAVKHNDPVTQKAGTRKARSAVEHVLTQIENRNVKMDQFINKAMNGEVKLNQQQLLGLQAKVAEYSLELDLTGKVVEKATNGLKDTLRTQV
jgi:hypothetical protein